MNSGLGNYPFSKGILDIKTNSFEQFKEFMLIILRLKIKILYIVARVILLGQQHHLLQEFYLEKGQ